MSNSNRTISFVAAAAAVFFCSQSVGAQGTFDFDTSEFASAAAGEQSYDTSTTGEGPQGVGADVTSAATSNQVETSQRTRYGLLTPGTAGGYTQVPYGYGSLGFPAAGPMIFSASGGVLPQTSSSSVGISITDGW